MALAAEDSSKGTAMPRPNSPDTAVAIRRILEGEPVADVAIAMDLDRSHLYRVLRKQGLVAPVCNKRGRRAKAETNPA